MLSPNKQKALHALLTHPTKQAAATAAGITTRCLRQYLADEEFQREYTRAFTELVNDATRQVQRALSPAIAALRDIVEDEESTASSRIAAARSLLEYGLRFTELNDIEQRIERLEQSIKVD